MRKALASLSIVLVLGGCAQLQTLQNVAKFATATITNPVTKAVQSKLAYCERANDLIVCGGIYK